MERNRFQTNIVETTTTEEIINPPVAKYQVVMTAMMTMEETIVVKDQEICGIDADTYSASAPILNLVPNSVDTIEPVAVQFNVVPQGLSPRLEMRLALNRDIMGDEDLINYGTGPDLSTILG